MARKECSINGIRWVAVEMPTPDDLSFITELFDYHPFIVESIVAPTLHPLAELFSDHLFLILHFPLIERNRDPNHIVEMDCLITKNLLVTITYMPFEDLDVIFKNVQENSSIRNQLTHKHTDFLVYHIVDRLFKKQFEDLDFFEREITQIENKIFKDDERITVEDIAHTRRDIIDFRRSLKPQVTVLSSFVEKATRLYGKKSMVPYWTDLLTSEDRIRNIIDNQKETMDVLYQTNESLLSSKLSRIIAILTIFSAVILPLNFIASIWGMNQRVMPLRDNPDDFWILIGAMAAVAALLLLYFRKKRWL
jgi:magnesium transporter